MGAGVAAIRAKSWMSLLGSKRAMQDLEVRATFSSCAESDEADLDWETESAMELVCVRMNRFAWRSPAKVGFDLREMSHSPWFSSFCYLGGSLAARLCGPRR